MKFFPAIGLRKSLFPLGLISVLFSPGLASPGQEGAAFLDIPVGAGPAALGSAYTALATDAYAPTWNPAGLGFLTGNELAAQHLSYLESIHDEYLSFVHPLDEAQASRQGVGFSAQYLGTGDITRTDIDAAGNFVNPGGSFSNHFGSYNLSYGRRLSEPLSVGVTGKWINASLDGVSANAYALDLGSLYKVNEKLQLAGTLTNLGTKLTFLNEGDSLPMALHAGAAYQPTHQSLLTSELVYEPSGVTGFHIGGQWRALEPLSLRVGYRTDTLKGLSALAGFSTGLGIHVWGQELAYAWVPYGDLGNTQYISLLARFGAEELQKRNLIKYQTIKSHRTVKGYGKSKEAEASEPEYGQLMQLLSDDQEHVAKAGTK